MVNPHLRMSPRLRRNGLIVCLILLVAAGGFVVWRITRPSAVQQALKPTQQSAVRQRAAAIERYCWRQAGAAHCAKATGGEDTRYVLPAYMAKADSITPSRDERRLLVESPPNPVTPGKPRDIEVVKADFSVVRHIPDTITADGADFAWAANADFLLYTKPAAGKQDVYVYDIAGDRSTKLTSQPISAGSPQASADGRTVYAAATTDSGFTLVAIDSRTGKPSQANVDDVARQVGRIVNYTYNAATDRFYINGVSQTGKPALAIAAYNDGVLRVERLISDGTVYTPGAVTKDGLFVTRQTSGRTDYGILHGDGTYTASPLRPLSGPQFGLSQALSATAASSSAVAAGDYLYDYTAAPANGRLMTFAAARVPENCPQGTYNQIDILSRQGEDQAALAITDCRNRTTIRHYYRYEDGRYTDVLQAGMSPDCDALEAKRLSVELDPGCREDANKPDTTTPKDSTGTGNVEVPEGQRIVIEHSTPASDPGNGSITPAQ